MITHGVALLCVLGLAVGQLLFKFSANLASETGSLLSHKALAALLAAMGLYGLTSLAWVWVLQRIELGRVYPLMALAFVLVPLASHMVYGERFQPSYYVGVIFIVLGVIFVVRA